MRAIPVFLTAAALGVAGLAIPASARTEKQPDAKLVALLDGKTAGKPVDCIDTRFNDATMKAYGDALVYRVSRKLLYVNRTTGGCSDNPNDTFVAVRYQDRACRGDILRTVSLPIGMPTGSCALGSFTPYTTG